MTTSREDFEAWYWRSDLPTQQVLFRTCGGGVYILHPVQRAFEAYQAATIRARKIAQEMNQPAVAGAIGGVES